jgi:hypothetical protein
LTAHATHGRVISGEENGMEARTTPANEEAQDDDGGDVEPR